VTTIDNRAYSYYIVYDIEKAERPGHIEVTLPHPLEHVHQVEELAHVIASGFGFQLGDVVITNWIFLRRSSPVDVSTCGTCGRLETDPAHDPHVAETHDFN
jgi:hypothetical protein